MAIEPLKNRKEEWKRFTHLLSILFKYGFIDFLDRYGLEKWVPKRIKSEGCDESVRNLSTEQRIRYALEELGTTYIKLGQTMSNRSDLLPQELIQELAHLQDNVSPIKDFNIKSYLSEFYKEPLENLFLEVSENPLAAASVAQVHKAILNNENQSEVVIKIRRPDIEHLIKLDLTVLKYFAEFVVHNIESLQKYRPVELIEDFEDAIMREINFKNELSNAERFEAMFRDDDDVDVPKVYPELSSKEILVMDIVNGVKVSQIDDMNLTDQERKKLAKKGVKVFFKQVMEKGFYHADPHPGNFFILPNQQLSFIDFGMMGVILPQDKENLGDLFFSIIQKDPVEILRMIKIIAKKVEIEDEQKVIYQINELLSKYADADLKEIDFSDLTYEIRKLLNKNEIVMPFYVFQLLRTLMIIEGIGVKLHPDFNIFDEMEGYLQKIILQKIHPKRILMRSIKTVRQLDRLTNDLPADLNEIITKLRDGELQFSFEVKEKREIEKSINKVTNRLVVAILIAALSIGSAMIVGTKMPPLVYDIPLLGIIGFTVSGLLGIFVVITIIRRDLF